MSQRKKTLAIIFSLTISIIVVFFLFSAGKNISYSVQSEYFDNVRSIASIIFGVTGAWLAITYPKALSSAREARRAPAEERDAALAKASEDSEILIGFVRTMIISVVVISISLAIPFVKEVFAMHQWAVELKEYFRGTLYSILGIISVIQLGLLATTLKNTYRALTDLHRETAEAATRSERDRNRQY